MPGGYDSSSFVRSRRESERRGREDRTKLPAEQSNFYRTPTKAHLEDLKVDALKWALDASRPPKRKPSCTSFYTRASVWGTQEPPIIRPHLWFDVDLVLAWINTCETHHGSHCRPLPVESADSFRRPLWLIDVHRGKLKKAEHSDRYLALSYVWGKPGHGLIAKKENVDFLQCDGALNDAQDFQQIPQTIRDAMRFVKIIGQKYLWVDRLCIVQDDDEAKQAQIDSMAAIYTNAYLTLIATSGSSAECGLRGISGDRLPFASYQDISSHHSLVNDSVWNTRGWTLQEMVFSRRAIFFHDHMVTWECHCAVWEELKKNGGLASKRNLVYPRWKCEERFFETGKGLKHSPWPDLEEYARLAYKFSLRNFTIADDTLHAFSGITAMLSRIFQHGFIYGLPELFFDAALLWVPQNATVARKKTSTAIQLPSWSWMGWDGPFEFINWASSHDYVFKSMRVAKSRAFWPRTSLRTKPILQWRSITTKDSEESRIIHHWILDKMRKIATGAQNVKALPKNWHFYESTGIFYCQSDPLTRFKYPVPILENENDVVEPASHNIAPLLSCRTSTARFRSPTRDWTRDLKTTVSLWKSDGAFIGILRSQAKDIYGDQEFELIAISAGEVCIDEYPNCHGRDLLRFLAQARRHFYRKIEGNVSEMCQFYNVLWVGWENGVAYRKGFGRILKDVWENEATEMIDVILG